MRARTERPTLEGTCRVGEHLMTTDRPLKTSPTGRIRSVPADDDGTGPPRAEGGSHGAAGRRRGTGVRRGRPGGPYRRAGQALADAPAGRATAANHPAVGPRMSGSGGSGMTERNARRFRHRGTGDSRTAGMNGKWSDARLGGRTPGRQRRPRSSNAADSPSLSNPWKSTVLDTASD
jgi:hypothetical protein